MEIRMIKTFETIVKQGSFQKAAEALQYSQPTITTHIKKLESELGVELFTRGKKIKLTEVGQLFYARSIGLLKEYEGLNHLIEDYHDGEAGHVRIGGSEPWVSQFMPSVLYAFMEKYPKVHVSIINDNIEKLNQMLAEDEIDFALGTEPYPNGKTEFEGLRREPLALLVPSGHRLAAKPQIFTSDLHNERFLITMGNCPFRIKVESIFAEKLPQNQQRTIEVSSITTLKYYVQANLGIALVPSMSMSPQIPSIIIRHIADLDIDFQIGILKKTSTCYQSPSILRLIDEVRQSLLKPVKMDR
ncbi:LysR family transcriptional regulator [Paenibacillus senegalimassiliensis]|uniref:LysR family transcriptional regulator n=1 Tax=Paenibacillus senegalimassiliensis TaxID=1737426 RepID=UPI00073EBE7F|nr:LysR family transcriptional regulator [Paenibacillus senegalimassiliensis]